MNLVNFLHANSDAIILGETDNPTKGNSRPKMQKALGCCPFDLFFQKFVLSVLFVLFKYAISIGVSQIRGALLYIFTGKKYPFISLSDAAFYF